MKPEPEKTGRIIGPVFGVMLFIIWISFLLLVESNIYPQQSFIHKPLIIWLNYGLIPFFVNAGNYLLYSRKSGSFQTFRSVTMLKSSLLGFLIWLLVIGLFFIQSGISYWTNVLGGYFTIIVVYFLWYGYASRKYPHSNLGTTGGRLE